MRKNWSKLEQYRQRNAGAWSSRTGDHFGTFLIEQFAQQNLRVIATDGDYKAAGLSSDYAWEHVSVSLANRCPTWAEMCFVKELFWDDDECVMQLHPPKKDYRNYHPHTLHLWRPLLQKIPRPPGDAVAPAGINANA